MSYVMRNLMIEFYLDTNRSLGHRAEWNHSNHWQFTVYTLANDLNDPGPGPVEFCRRWPSFGSPCGVVSHVVWL